MKKRSLSDLGKSELSKNVCVCFALRKAARSISQFYGRFLSDTGVGASQNSLLMIAYLADGIPISKMAEIAVMERTTLTRNLRPLEKQGLIAIQTGEDRRMKIVTITKKGMSVLRKVIPKWEQAQIEMETRLGSKKFDKLINDLSQIVNQTQT